MTNSNQTLVYDIESFTNRKFHYPKFILALFDCSVEYGLQWELADIIFTAKFLQKALNSIKRTGQLENREKFLSEYQEKIEKLKHDLELICGHASEDEKSIFMRTFLQNTQDCLQNLNKLIEDLSWVKNYEIDNNTKIRYLLKKN